jgi:hypothetical protein
VSGFFFTRSGLAWGDDWGGEALQAGGGYQGECVSVQDAGRGPVEAGASPVCE